jgi:holo-[acyl-carrier protein] synthase
VTWRDDCHFQRGEFMSEWNIGVDVVEVARFERLDYSKNKRFYSRIFSPKEIEYCLSFDSPAPHFAVNFAGKEAVYKAVNKFCNIKLGDIEILRDKKGTPKVNLRASPKDNPKPLDVKVSLSHSFSHAVAFGVARLSNNHKVDAEVVLPNGF